MTQRCFGLVEPLFVDETLLEAMLSLLPTLTLPLTLTLTLLEAMLSCGDFEAAAQILLRDREHSPLTGEVALTLTRTPTLSLTRPLTRTLILTL